jgi:hypothetical protein
VKQNSPAAEASSPGMGVAVVMLIKARAMRPQRKKMDERIVRSGGFGWVLWCGIIDW